MFRLLPILALLCLGFNFAEPSPTPAPIQLAWGAVQMAGGAEAAATPTATPIPGGNIYTEDNCAVITEWTNISTPSGGWVFDTLSEPDNCDAAIDDNNEWAAMIQGPTTSHDEFCSFYVASINTTDPRLGCIFRSQNTTDDHVVVYFDNKYSKWKIDNHNGEDANNHGLVDDLNASADCNSTCGSSWSDIGPSNYYGITFVGTEADSGDMAVEWWDLGSGPDSGVDLEDPSTWAGNGDLKCACADGDISDAFTMIDSLGSCGPAAFSDSAALNNTPNILEFACGDTP